MKSKEPIQIEINADQPEWKVVQRLVQLGFQKACWYDDLQTEHIEVYCGLGCFSNYSNKTEKDNVLTLLEFTNLVYEEIK